MSTGYAGKHPPMKMRRQESSECVEEQEIVLHQCIAALMREFRLEPGMLAGSPYSHLHANDIGLFELLTEPGEWNVRAISRVLGAPISTVSSALDRLERCALINRTRIAADRRVVRVELTSRGSRLAVRLRGAHVLNCRAMLVRLTPDEREEFLRLAAKIARPHKPASGDGWDDSARLNRLRKTAVTLLRPTGSRSE
jgi:DNA-binding MarR family transcriptional regulator